MRADETVLTPLAHEVPNSARVDDSDALLRLAADTLRVLAIDAIELAQSGHPGMPMGMADIAAVLWTEFLCVDPDDPAWPDRDRFILSNGHGSMLLYALLHLSGFDLSLDDLRRFRRYGSATPGHPEFGHTPGVEVTTGPLGQGFAAGVGMAIAEEHLRAKFGSDLVDHRVFGFVSDGDLMEGVAQEAASLAGHLGLGKLIYFYDDNEITIDGSTELAFSQDVLGVFRAKGWHTERIDGHDRAAIRGAIERATEQEQKPSLIACRTVIGRGAPNKEGTSGVHGAPLGPEESLATKEAMSWSGHDPFFVPSSVYDLFAAAMRKGRTARRSWTSRLDATLVRDRELRGRWHAHFDPGKVSLHTLNPKKHAATRAHSGQLFEQLEEAVPGLLGGSADLASSTKTRFPGAATFSRTERQGRNVCFGVREHAMGAVVNGLTLHSGTRGYGSTFLVFSDYMRPAIRLASLMGLPSVFVFTHDSIFVGQDGPTHQPIEHVASLRLIPNLWVIRPADAVETTHAWEIAINRHEGPTAIVLTRQTVPALPRTSSALGSAGTSVLREGRDAVVIATGSEVSLALQAANLLSITGIELRVVSVPCVEALEALPIKEQEELFGVRLPRVTLEAGATAGWKGLAGADGLTLGLDCFGASGSADELANAFGFTAEAVATKINEWLRERRT